MSQPQHIEALAKANRVRLARSELKRSIKQGKTSVADVLNPTAEIPWEARTMSVSELLASQHNWGRTRVRKTVMPLGIGERRAVGALTPRQRCRLIERISGVEIDDHLLYPGTAAA